MNDDFYVASFEVYYISVRQKLVVLGFSHKIFFILTSVTSESSWGQTMDFSDLTEAQILGEDVSFYMEYCLLNWDENWSIQRPLFLSGHFWTTPASLTDQKARIV